MEFPFVLILNVALSLMTYEEQRQFYQCFSVNRYQYENQQQKTFFCIKIVNIGCQIYQLSQLNV